MLVIVFPNENNPYMIADKTPLLSSNNRKQLMTKQSPSTSMKARPSPSRGRQICLNKEIEMVELHPPKETENQPTSPSPTLKKEVEDGQASGIDEVVATAAIPVEEEQIAK